MRQPHNDSDIHPKCQKTQVAQLLIHIRQIGRTIIAYDKFVAERRSPQTTIGAPTSLESNVYIDQSHAIATNSMRFSVVTMPAKLEASETILNVAGTGTKRL